MYKQGLSRERELEMNRKWMRNIEFKYPEGIPAGHGPYRACGKRIKELESQLAERKWNASNVMAGVILCHG